MEDRLDPVDRGCVPAQQLLHMSQAKAKKATVSFVAIIDGKFVVYTEVDEVPPKVAKDALATSNNDFAGNHCPRRRARCSASLLSQPPLGPHGFRGTGGRWA